MILGRTAVGTCRAGAALLFGAGCAIAFVAPLALGLVVPVPLLAGAGWRRMDVYAGASGLAFVALAAGMLASVAFGRGPATLAPLGAYLGALVASVLAGWRYLALAEERGHARRQIMEDVELDLAHLREELDEQGRALAATENRRKRFKALQEVVTALAENLEAERLADVTLREVGRILSGLPVNVGVFLLDERGDEMLRRTLDLGGRAPFPEGVRIQDDPLNAWVLEKCCSLPIRDLEKDFRFRGLDLASIPGRSFHLAPMVSQGRVMGLVRVESSERNALNQEDQRLVDSLAVIASLAFENARLYREARELSDTDGLTRLLLRRSVMQRLEVELKRGDQGAPLSLIMLDIDHFKAVNDTYGHPAGDVVLREVAQILRRSVRDVDVCGRYGGEEFLVVLPNTPTDGALRVAERIREAVRSKPFPLRGEERRITVSMGVATAAPEARAEEFIARADEALYRAKQGGRDRVCAAPSPGDAA